VKKLIVLRTGEVALRRGTLAQVYSKNPVLAFLRTAGESRILVAKNSSTGTLRVKFPIQGKAWSTYEMTDLLRERLVKQAGSSTPLPLSGPGKAVLRIGPGSVPDGAWLLY
jgi:hypothetical protein